MRELRVGLVGDRDESVTAHRAIPIALERASTALGLKISTHWLATESLIDTAGLAHFQALWCIPASPYRSMDGALRAIRFARENQVPFLGTCGGFQHGVIEYARNVLGWAQADHAETAPNAAMAVIAPLACALVEKQEPVLLREGSRLREAYGKPAIHEGYRCRFGLNPEFVESLTTGPLTVAATDGEGAVRGLELSQHPFFVMTLFQPERAALEGRIPPIVTALLKAAQEQEDRRSGGLR